MHEEIPLLEVKGLKKYYPITNGMIPHITGKIYAVDGVDLSIETGKTLGLVGESGCGKSTIGRLITSLERPTEGEIYYQGQRIDNLADKQMKNIRMQIQMVFQDPFSSLNPRKTIMDIIAKPMLYHGICTKQNVNKEVDKLLELVGLQKNSKEKYSYEFSGGQRQRIGIARALSLNPKLIICDEPVSALDVSIQAQILNLLLKLQTDLGISYLFIGHGLDAVNYVSHRIAVMYLGKIVEIADADNIFKNPIHPYTMALCNASPIPNPEVKNDEKAILDGEIPSAASPPLGCRFHPRCPYRQSTCEIEEPALKPTNQDSFHLVACPIRAN